MTYRVVYKPRAQRHLLRLPLKVVDAVVAFIEGPIAADPRRVGKPLSEPFTGQYSARREAFRVIYEIDDDTIEVDLVRIGHRVDVYRA